MANKMIARIAMTFAAFTLSYVCGSVSQPHASAQIPGGPLGGDPLAAAGQLGSSITEMEQHVSGLILALDSEQPRRRGSRPFWPTTESVIRTLTPRTKSAFSATAFAQASTLTSSMLRISPGASPPASPALRGADQ